MFNHEVFGHKPDQTHVLSVIGRTERKEAKRTNSRKLVSQECDGLVPMQACIPFASTTVNVSWSAIWRFLGIANQKPPYIVTDGLNIRVVNLERAVMYSCLF